MKVRHVSFYPVDWIEGIAGLTVEQQGIYWLICALNYATGEPVDLDGPKLRSLCGCHWRTLKRVARELQDMRKIAARSPQEPRKVWAKRCQEELKKASGRVARASHGAAERWKNNRIGDASDVHQAHANEHEQAILRARVHDSIIQKTKRAGVRASAPDGAAHAALEHPPPTPEQIEAIASTVDNLTGRLRLPVEQPEPTAEERAAMIAEWNKQLGVDE